MPYMSHRIITVCPAGRKEYLEMSLPMLEAYHNSGILDEHHLWINTHNKNDIDYMYSLEAKYNWIHCISLPPGIVSNGNTTIRNFLESCGDYNTVYIRIDDDIIVLDKLENFKEFLAFRINNPQHFLVYATILTNGQISYHLQNQHILDETAGKMDSSSSYLGWSSPEFAKNLHDQVLHKLKTNNTLSDFHYKGNVEFVKYERVSVNFISWLGDTFWIDCKGFIMDYPDEEETLACLIPYTTKKQI